VADRARYDSAMFWLAFGTAAAVIGLALMTIGVTRTGATENLFANLWFDSGGVLLGIGALLLLLALVLYLARRRSRAEARTASGSQAGSDDANVEAVRGYYAERGRLIDMYERQQKRKSKSR
jgi:hypothetical protein